jgi:hypothetical protein
MGSESRGELKVFLGLSVKENSVFRWDWDLERKIQN